MAALMCCMLYAKALGECRREKEGVLRGIWKDVCASEDKWAEVATRGRTYKWGWSTKFANQFEMRISLGSRWTKITRRLGSSEYARSRWKMESFALLVRIVLRRGARLLTCCWIPNDALFQMA